MKIIITLKIKSLFGEGMFERILIATDGSKHSERAAEVGTEMAKLYHGKVTALYVVDIGKEYVPLGDLSSKSSGEMIAGIRSSLLKKGEDATQKVEEIAKKAGIPVEKEVIEGYPADDILRLAVAGKMDLIVVGGIGVTGLDRFLLGSVAEKVVRNSKVPVMVVRAK